MDAGIRTNGPLAGTLASRVEETCLNAWPALQEVHYDGWLLRLADGKTRRTNSVNVLRHGSRPLSEKIALQIKPEQTPLSLCCSSGTVGHSLSFGMADACMTGCRSGAEADAFATALCNQVKNEGMVHEVAEQALGHPQIVSVVIIAGDKLALGGKIEVKIV